MTNKAARGMAFGKRCRRGTQYAALGLQRRWVQGSSLAPLRTTVSQKWFALQGKTAQRSHPCRSEHLFGFRPKTVNICQHGTHKVKKIDAKPPPDGLLNPLRTRCCDPKKGIPRQGTMLRVYIYMYTYRSGRRGGRPSFECPGRNQTSPPGPSTGLRRQENSIDGVLRRPPDHQTTVPL